MKIHFAQRYKERVPLLIILLLGMVFLVCYFWGQNKDRLTGEIEADVVSHKAEVAGKIVEMPVALGSYVKKGDLIAKIDSSGQDYAIEQIELSLEKKKLALAEAQLGVGGNTQAANNLAVAQAAQKSAEAAYAKADQDYQHALELYQEGAIAKDSLDSAKLKADTAANALAAAKAQTKIAAGASSAKSIELDIRQIESQLRQMQETLAKYSLKAVTDGVIISKSYGIGDMVNPGTDLADVASDEEKYFVFYLPKELLDSVTYGQALTVTASGKQYRGVVKYIDVTSQYTPKDLQTSANKNRESFKVKLLLPADVPLKPGQQAELDGKQLGR